MICPEGPERTVSFEYQFGFLTRIPGYTDAAVPIAYHPNGLIARVPHANGVTDHVELDPHHLFRANRIYTTGVQDESGDFDSGELSYDGAGNITRIGEQGDAVYDAVSPRPGTPRRRGP